MSKKKTKEAVSQHKSQAISKINNLLEEYLSAGQDNLLKKTDLISYWIESFVNYVSFEDQFDSSRLLRYKRGNVIRVNLGFNIGKEMGGLHYAVVIDNDNKRSSDVLTVIPLSSSNGKKVHHRSVDLGTELFEKVNIVQQNLLQSAQNELDELIKTEQAFTTTMQMVEKMIPSNRRFSHDITEKINLTTQYQKDITAKRDSLQKNIDIIKRNMQEILKLKRGSMAVVNQITTISKQRIYTPKQSEDFLYGITLSNSALDRITDKIKELYIYS